jgi:hypothetical protein
MIEQGLVALVQGDAGVSGLCSAGGFFAELPKGQSLAELDLHVRVGCAGLFA